jgi:hypothetical protein
MVAQPMWLDVPFEEKDEAKALGARWDPVARRWFAPRPGMRELDRWYANSTSLDLLPGEDRTLGSDLFVDLVPLSCWFTNVRSCVRGSDWEWLHRMVLDRALRQCEVCGAPAWAGPRRTPRLCEHHGVDPGLHLHERWVYDDATRVQILRRLICLCSDCHLVTHFGQATLRGLQDIAFAHLMTVAGLNGRQARRHVDSAFTRWRQRSAITWSLDLSMLTDAGVAVTPPPENPDRVGASPP